MLNTEKAPRFQCYGFSVTRNNPIQIVPAHAQEFPLRRALEAGILLDVTGKEDTRGNKIIAAIDKAIKAGTLTSVEEGEEAGPKALIGTDAKGNSYVIVPKDEEDYQRIQEELRLNGFIRREKPKSVDFTGLSAIYEQDLPPEPECQPQA
jgi:hypothetical protein